MKRVILMLLTAALSACIPTISQEKLQIVESGERIDVAAPLKVTENRGLAKVEWEILPGSYVERFLSASGRVFLSEGHFVRATTTLGEKTVHPGGFILLKDKPGLAKLYIVRGKSGYKVPDGKSTEPGWGKDLIVIGIAGVEGDLTLIADFKLSELKRR
jgi:hypothetical protein